MSGHIVKIGEKVPSTGIVCKEAASNTYRAALTTQNLFMSLTKKAIEEHPITVLSVKLGEFYIKTILASMPSTKIQS